MESDDQRTESNKTQEVQQSAMQAQHSDSEGSQDHDDAEKLKKMSGKQRIKAITRGFDEMIEFMDFSFERAF